MAEVDPVKINNNNIYIIYIKIECNMFSRCN